MFDPSVTVSALLGAGLAAASAGLMVQTRAKRGQAAQIALLEKQCGSALDHQRAMEEQRDAAVDYNRAVETEVRHFADARMPALMDTLARGHHGVRVPGLSQERLAGGSVDLGHQAVIGLFQEAVTTVREQVGRTARSSVRDIIDEAQTQLHRCQMNVIAEMERYPEGTAYHQSLMGFDHLVTQALQYLQRTRILTGSWPGLQRADCEFREVVESARGRIGDYQRVKYAYDEATGSTWLEGRVVEPVAVALAELLSNATSYSDGQVFVEVQAFQTGYCIVVDDGGLNMNASQRAQAAAQLTQHTVLDVTTLQDTRQLGFAVIGRLAGEYGFAADVSSTSPYGGVRAVLRIPRDLFGQGPTEEEAAAERAAAASYAARAEAHPYQDDDHVQEPPGQGSGTQLPQRRRRAPRPAAAPRSSAPAPVDNADAFSESFARLAQTIRDTESGHPFEGDHRA
ncbi:sensor histidine kinase [Streptomyces sp. SHP 1-2]|nr:sensor histidine kinase [Streptomyces sp. SHP 1-2]